MPDFPPSPSSRVVEGICPLCAQRRKLTEEHVLPQWLLKDTGDMTEDAPTVWVCGACNQWMNRQFEQRAMSLLRSLVNGESRSVTRKQRRALAAWATKTLMMCSIATHPSLQGRTPAQFRYLRARGNALPNSRVYLGQVAPHVLQPNQGVEDNAGPVVDALQGPVVPPDAERVPMLAQLMPNIAFVIYFSKDGHWPDFLDHPWFRTFFRQLHPPVEGPLDWPSKWAMDRAFFAEILCLGMGE